ncbi:S8 family peptidase [Streptomyces cahuitamycinicus]|uniref:Peptidase S8 n=1 Tax=Streptomyces cahuitamycinicus TaxID=2070367 RepID=A0A2N8TUZ3_9ACTN|nr:S8 family peptidase [Streptomyces cahuitamycinicus]PNG22821.1 peptidase S8 [Streptomyces cahuitamycinicus]
MREIFTARRRIVAAISAVAAAAAIGSGTALPAEATPSAGRILQEDSANAVENSYIVVLKESAGFRANSTKGEDLVAKYGATVDWTYDAVLNGYAIRISASGAKSLAEDPAVEFVEQDRMVHLEATQYNPPWGLDRIDQPRFPRNLMYSYPDTAGKSATVYVIDTGVRITHTEFAGRARHGYDFVDRDANASDGNGHGTHVATTVAGKTYGVAKQSKIVSVRVLDNRGAGTLSGVIAGVDWVTVRRVRPAVANMSLGAGVSTSLDTAVRNSIASGVTYAVAAGNSNANAASFSPARVRSALTVGASTWTDSRSSFSNYGSQLDMFAPGSLITAGWHTSDTATTTLSGTSMATPHVAGAAAVYLTSHPSAGPATVHSALVNGATTGVLRNVGTGSPNRLLRLVP